jgi:ferredoxin-NADP reductase
MSLEVVIRDSIRLAEGVVGLELASAAGALLPPFEPGAHVALHLPNGLVRHYSLYGDSADRSRYLIAVLRQADSRGGSRFIHDAIRPGDRLALSEPANHFQLDPSAARSLLVAGGIGITPILAMARSLLAQGRTFELYYLSRSRQHAPFLDFLQSSGFKDSITIHHSCGNRRLDMATVLRGVAADTHVYCCGPPGLLSVVRDASLHLLPGRFHSETFVAEENLKRDDDASFTVHLTKRDMRVTVGADETILNALLRAGVDVDYSCQEGTCGTCVVEVAGGIPDHRDSVLSDIEHARGKMMTICCSRSKSRELLLKL